MKLPILFLAAFMCVGAAFADDNTVQNLTARKTCAEIKFDMDALSAMENIDDVNAEKLKQFQVYYRANCVPKSSGRRTVARNIPVIVKNTEPITTSDALSEYLANKKSNCEKLNSEIAKMAAANDESKSDALASMRGVYDMDCTEKPVAMAPAEPAIQTDEEWAAEYDANLAAGLCGDGTKPNRFGCCTGETFKDLGNDGFACCLKAGGMCFPPMK